MASPRWSFEAPENGAMGHQTLTRMAVNDGVYADNTEDLIASLDQGPPSESQSADSTDTLRSLISAAAPM